MATFFARRRGHDIRRALGIGLLLVAVPSFAWSIYLTPVSPGSAYFITTTRMWELAIGRGPAIFAPVMAKMSRPLAQVLTLAGLAGILLASVTYGATTLFPGIRSDAAGPGDDGSDRGRHLPPGYSRWKGDEPTSVRRHRRLLLCPLPVALAVYRLGDSTLGRAVYRSCASCRGRRHSGVLDSYTRVEQPIGSYCFYYHTAVVASCSCCAHRRWYSRRVLAVRPATKSRAVGCEPAGHDHASAAGDDPAAPDSTRDDEHSSDGRLRFADDDHNQPNYHDPGSTGDRGSSCGPVDHPGSMDRCRRSPDALRRGMPSESDESRPHLMSLRGRLRPGDSARRRLARGDVGARRLLADEYGFQLETYTKSACGFATVDFVIGEQRIPYDSCSEWNDRAMEKLIGADRPDLVVTSSFYRWTATDENGEAVSVADSQPILAAGLVETWSQLQNAGVPWSRSATCQRLASMCLSVSVTTVPVSTNAPTTVLMLLSITPRR